MGSSDADLALIKQIQPVVSGIGPGAILGLDVVGDGDVASRDSGRTRGVAVGRR